MLRNVKVLIVLNLLSYFNNIVFSYAYTNKSIKENWGLLGVWVIIPYIFLTVTSFIFATDYNEDYKIFKKEAIADWIIRFASCLIVFQEFNFSFLSKEYLIQQSLLGLLLIASIILEYSMYKKAKEYVKNHYQESESNEKIPEAEKQNIKNIGKAAFLGVFSLIVVSVFSMPISGFLNGSGDRLISKIVPFVISITVFVWFINVNYKKCNLFFIDSKLARKIFIRDSIYAILGFAICYVSAILMILNKVEDLSGTLVLGILLLYPTIQTDRKISLRYKKIKDALGDNFYLYFTCKDEEKK